MRILLVEEDATLRDVLARALRDRGIQVETSGSFEEAQDRLVRGRFDVVVADLKLGEANGAELLEGVSHGRRILTFSLPPSREELGMADAFVAKPFDADDLLAAIDLDQ